MATKDKGKTKREAKAEPVLKREMKFERGDIAYDGNEAMIIIAGFITPHSGRSLYVGIGMDGELLSQYGDSLKFSDAPANVFQENFVLNLGGEDALRSPFRARSAVEAVSAS